MTQTLASILAIVRFRGDLRNAIRFPDADLTKEIQGAFGEGYELVADTNEGYYDVTATLSTVAGTDFVALTTGTWRVRAMDRLDGSDYLTMTRVGLKDRNRWGSARGKPEGYRLSARGAELFPTPDAIYTLRQIYTPVAPTLDSTAREFYNGWEEYTIYGALVRLYLNQNRDASEWERQLAMQRARLTSMAGERNASGPEYLNLFEGDGADWDLPPTWSW